jgi:F420-dependent oxidoreductase-like protein
MRLAAAVAAGKTIDQAVKRAQLAERLGLDSVWVNQLPNERDAAIVLAAYATATERIGLGTAVLPIYTRHPTAMAQMAASLDELSGGRFRLGIGISHKVTVEGMWGLRLEAPMETMREYLSILRPSLREGAASVDGTRFTARWAYTPPRRGDLPILLGSVNQRMLELAGELADGVLLWMCSPAYVRDQVVPSVSAGRQRAGLPLRGFEIVAAVPVSLTSNRAAGRQAFRPTVERYASLPFYRRMLDASGYAEELSAREVGDRMVDELAGIGGEEDLARILRSYEGAGCTVASVGPFSGYEGAAGFEATLEAAAAIQKTAS